MGDTDVMYVDHSEDLAEVLAHATSGARMMLAPGTYRLSKELRLTAITTRRPIPDARKYGSAALTAASELCRDNGVLLLQLSMGNSSNTARDFIAEIIQRAIDGAPDDG